MDDRRGVPLLSRPAVGLATAPSSTPRPRSTAARVLPGYLIAFEGGDGAGKSTQARLLGEWLATSWATTSC